MKKIIKIIITIIGWLRKMIEDGLFVRDKGMGVMGMLHSTYLKQRKD